MTKDELIGLVILFKNDKSLTQTKRIRICQRENMADRMSFLIPFSYEGIDLTKFTITMEYIGQDGTIRAEVLTRLSDGEGGYIDYEDSFGNKTHMIYILPVTSKITQFAGDITVKLTMDYIDEEGQTQSEDDNNDAPEPQPIHYVLNSDSTIITVMANADYYSVVSDESLSLINNKIAELNAKQAELEATAEIYDTTKADNIKLDDVEGELYLTSKGNKIGDAIDLNDLGNATADDTTSGLVTVVI